MCTGCLAISGGSLDSHWAQVRLENALGGTVIRVEPCRRYNLAEPRLVPVFIVLLLYPFYSRNRFTL